MPQLFSRLSTSTSTDPDPWAAFISQQPLATFYHRYEWSLIAKQALHYEPCWLTYSKNSRIQGGVTLFRHRGFLTGNRVLTSPFGEADWLGAVPNGDIFQSFQDYQINYLTKTADGLATPMKAVHWYSGYELDTTGQYQTIWGKKVHKKTRNMVRKAQKMGLIIDTATQADLDQFYEMYLATMRKVGSVPFPKAVFELAWLYFSKDTQLLKVTYHLQVVGYLWVFIGEHKALIWANATDEAYLSWGSNYLLYDNAIQLACNLKKITSLDFGGSAPDSPQAFYKARWGGEAKPVYMVSNQLKHVQSRLQNQSTISKVLRFLPLPVLKLGAGFIYRYV